ncbi:MAG: hypothetical protein IJR59_01825 [Firmicutes bacterium]|nr:hypothetical protein [Bacillota bacterium]
MYLEALNNKEKELFLSLAYNLSAAGKDYSPEERVTVASYCREMGIDFDMSKVNLSVDEVIDEISSVCSPQIKRIIVFEAMRLTLADLDYDDDERAILKKAFEKFGLDMSFHDSCEALINDFIELQGKINALIEG